MVRRVRVAGRTISQRVVVKPQHSPKIKETIETPEQDFSSPKITSGILSIMMPAKNAGKTIVVAVKSVLEQVIQDGWQIELLVGVDDCQDTLDALTPLLSDPRLKVFKSIVNVGPYIMRNSLFPLTKGTYVGSFDADDVMLPENLFKIISYINCDPQMDCITSVLQYADNKMKPQYKRKMDGNNSGAIYRRDVIETLGGWLPWKCAADLEFKIRVKAKGYKTKNLLHTGCLYRRHEGQLTKRADIGLGSLQRNQYHAEIKKRQSDWNQKKPVGYVEPVKTLLINISET
jgi:glycosyltransferase involved in cell wall biosynthesis